MIKVGMNATKRNQVLGMDDIGDYSQFASQGSSPSRLIDVYDSSTSRKNQALMAWNFCKYRIS